MRKTNILSNIARSCIKNKGFYTYKQKLGRKFDIYNLFPSRVEKLLAKNEKNNTGRRNEQICNVCVSNFEQNLFEVLKGFGLFE